MQAGPLIKKPDPNSKEMFETLANEWEKFDRTAMELLTICAGTAAANRWPSLLLPAACFFQRSLSMH